MRLEGMWLWREDDRDARVEDMFKKIDVLVEMCG